MSLRGVLRDAGSAGPELSLAVTCLLALLRPDIEARFAPRIGPILGMEFMALHAFGFLGLIALAKPAERWKQRLRIPAFLGLCVFYSITIYDWGTDAVVTFWTLMLSTYAGFLLHDAPEHRRQTLSWRWGIAFGLFFGMAMAAGLTAEFFNLRSPRKEFVFGLLFFAALGLCDLVHLYDRLVLRFSGEPAQTSG